MLAAGDAHVWIAALEELPPLSRGAAACLSQEEVERAAGIADPVARDRFRMGRALLRALLSTCTGIAPAELVFVRTARGKPVLLAGTPVEFSISHSRGRIAIAAATAPTGVDIEHARSPRYLDRTAERILHPDTVTMLNALAPDRRLEAFIAAWTLREAHVKAVGGGLFHTPDTLPFAAAADAGILRVVTGRDGSTWSCAHFVPWPGTRGAVVLQGAGHRLSLHDPTRTLQTVMEVYR